MDDLNPKGGLALAERGAAPMPVLDHFVPQKQPAKPRTKRLELVSGYDAAGDQPRAIAELVAGVESGERDQVLLGVTGSARPSPWPR